MKKEAEIPELFSTEITMLPELLVALTKGCACGAPAQERASPNTGKSGRQCRVHSNVWLGREN